MAPEAAHSTKTGPGRSRNRATDWREYIVYIGFVLIFIIFSVSLYSSGFMTSGNLLNIVRQTATISVMAVAMTFVIAAGEIDLSVGSAAGLASVVTAMLIRDFGIIAGMAGGLLTGVVIGTINGLLVTRVQIPSFLVTLGMMGIASGTGQWMTNTAPVPIMHNTYNNVFGSGNVLGIPSLFIWTLVLLVVGSICLRKMPYGRQILATGGNVIAARYSGVDTRRIKFTALLVMSVVASLAGMLYAGRLHSGRFQWGQGDEMSAIAATILGGTSLAGGVGSVVGAVVGSLMIGMINNGLILMGLEFSQQTIIRGVIIILSVALARRDVKS